jgi:hypothetical protein
MVRTVLGEWGVQYFEASRLGESSVADGCRIKLSPCGGYNDMSFTSPESVLETYKYYIKELDNRGLAYVQCTYYNAYGDANYDGKPQGWEHDVVKEYGPLM